MAGDNILQSLYAEYKSLMEEYHVISDKISKIADLIKAYGGNAKGAKELTEQTVEKIVTDIIDSMYPSKGDWAAKIRFTLKKFDKPLSVQEIYAFICVNEPDSFKQKGDNARGIVSSISSRMARAGELHRETVNSKMYFSIASYKK